MKSLGDFDYGFADRLRGIRYSGTGPDNKTYCDWLDEAADLLDECERALGALLMLSDGVPLTGVQVSQYQANARATLAKLRGETNA